MLKRLQENWLDNASEKSYQLPFCQILSGMGHTILHSTRHGPLEFGRDIITKNSNGELCAYQLKGNPGGRLTLKQFREIQGQLVQLITQAIKLPGNKTKRHKSYLVTNGLIEEEVIKAIEEFNQGYEQSGAIGAPLRIKQRGHLLALLDKYGTSIWPSEIKDLNTLLQILVERGDGIFPINLIHELYSDLLLLKTDKNSKSTEIKRRITSASLLTSISLNKYDSCNNYYSMIMAWILYCTYSIAACEKNNISYKKNAKKSIDIAIDEIYSCLSKLCEEIANNKHLVEGNATVDCFAFHGRYTLLVSLMSLYWIWSKEKGWPVNEHKDILMNFIPDDIDKVQLWGEGAVPQIIMLIWYLRSVDPTLKPDYYLCRLLNKIVNISLNKNGNGLPSPYYSYEEVLRHLMKKVLPYHEDPFRGDSFRNNSYFARSLMNLFVRTNLKHNCKMLWPNYSKVNFKHFKPKTKWEYCLWRTGRGREITKQVPNTQTWNKLVNEAKNIKCDDIPEALMSNKYLLMLFVILLPYRAIPTVISRLGYEFNDSWIISKPIGNE